MASVKVILILFQNGTLLLCRVFSRKINGTLLKNLSGQLIQLARFLLRLEILVNPFMYLFLCHTDITVVGIDIVGIWIERIDHLICLNLEAFKIHGIQISVYTRTISPYQSINDNMIDRTNPALGDNLEIHFIRRKDIQLISIIILVGIYNRKYIIPDKLPCLTQHGVNQATLLRCNRILVIKS